MIPDGVCSMFELDVALERILRERESIHREPPGPTRSLRMAHLADIEARLWSVLFESTEVRLHWRAALAAEAGARSRAEQWRRRAVAERCGTPTADPGMWRTGNDAENGDTTAASDALWCSTARLFGAV